MNSNSFQSFITSIVTELSKLVGDSIALIPVGADKMPKVKKWQGEPKLNIFELLDLMRHAGTSYVAMRCGSVSDGVLVADIDEKHYYGISERILKGLVELWPEIWEKLRIEKTPSGGYHILWRFFGQVESKNYCHRETTPEEREIDPKIKKKCFVEIKGEGSLCHCFPSNGYVIEKESGGDGVRLVKFLSLEEHASLLNYLRSYNEVFEEKKERKTSWEDNYDENPFVAFNNSEEGSRVLEAAGWKVVKDSGSRRYYSKPSRIGKDVDASYDFSSHMFKIWTTTTSLESRGYSPSALKIALEFKDASEGYHWFVANGYGKLRPAIESSIIKREARKKEGVLPANFSEKGRVKFEEERVKLKEKYPYGVFWKIGEEGGFKISRELFLRIAGECGFRKKKNDLCYIDGYIVRYVERDYFFQYMKAYIKEEDDDLLDTYEAFLQASGNWTCERFRDVDESLILRSTAEISYKFFSNCYVEITQDGEKLLDYKELDKLVWEDKIHNRPYRFKKDYSETSGGFARSLYYDFLNKAIGVDTYLMQCIGYYCHDFRDTRGYMVIATESCENSGNGGGNGKNIFWSLLELSTTFKSVPAAQANMSRDLFQSWNKERLFVLSDMQKDFKIDFLKDIITGNAVVNKKFINEYEVGIEDMPKMGGSSNFVFDLSHDGGLKRRIRYLEFSEFFKRHKGVDKYYKKMFPTDWEDYEYLWFDNFISDCIKTFLECNYEIEQKEMSDGGWVKQFENGFNLYLLDFFNTNIDSWEGREVTSKYVGDLYKQYCADSGCKPFGKIAFNRGLEVFCKYKGIDLKNNIQITENGIRSSGMRFGGVSVKIEEELPF